MAHSQKTRSVSSMSFKSKIREDHLTCSICYNSFVKPKALPCIHTFCENCLRDYITGRGYDREGQFPCPLCRTVILIPPGGVGDFPSNHMAQSLLDTVDSAAATQSKNKSKPLPPPPIPPRPFNPRIASLSSEGNSERGGKIHNSRSLSESVIPSIYPQLHVENPSRNQIPTVKECLARMPCSDNMLQRFGTYGAGLSNFHKPYGLAVNREGEILISDLGGNRVFRYSRQGELLNKFACDCVVKDLACTPENDILITVAKSGSSIMRLYDQNTGRLKSTYGTFYRYDNPSGLALTPSNYALVTGLENNVVYVFTEQRQQSCKFGHKGSGNEHFSRPQFVTSNSKNQIIVSDTGNNCIKLYDITGNFKHRLGNEGTEHGYFRNPLGLCTDSKGNLIVADSGNSRVEVFSSKGKFVTSIIENTERIAPGVKPVHVAVTPNDDLVVLLVGNQFAEVRIYMWNPSSVADDSCSSCRQQ